MASMLLLSYLGSFGGIHYLQFPLDLIAILPLSIIVLEYSQRVLLDSQAHEALTAHAMLAESEAIE